MNEKEKWLVGEDLENENLSPDEEVIHEQNKTIERLREQLKEAVVILMRFERVTPSVVGGKYLQADLERFYKKWGVK